MTTNELTSREGRRRLSVAHLLIALVAMFVVSPFADTILYGRIIESVAFTLVLLFAVSAVGARRRTLVTAAILAAPALLTRWADHIRPNLLPIEFSLAAAIAFVLFIIFHLFRFVIFARTVNSEVLCAALSIYLLFAVAWAFAYTLLATWDPNAFVFTDIAAPQATLTGFTALYFSVEILTSLAFGDIVPVSNIARMVTLMEAIAGMFYMAILIARLVGLYVSQRTVRGPHV